MEKERIKVRITQNSPYSDYGYYERGNIGYIDGYVNNNAVIILENGKFVKADLRWIEVVDEEDNNVNSELKESEDERIRKALINGFNKLDKSAVWYNGITNGQILAWLEKQDELKPAWSEEDKERYKSCLQRLGTGNPEQPETINSKWFKEHVYPQNTWKPSDEQMKALKEACDEHWEPDGLDPLYTLWEQLKKLREE